MKRFACLGVFFVAIAVYLDEWDLNAECLFDLTCTNEARMDHYADCVELLSPKDLALFLKTMDERFEGHATDVRTVFKEACRVGAKNLDYVKKTVDYYQEQRAKEELNSEDKLKYQQARDCLATALNLCESMQRKDPDA